MQYNIHNISVSGTRYIQIIYQEFSPIKNTVEIISSPLKMPHTQDSKNSDLSTKADRWKQSCS